MSDYEQLVERLREYSMRGTTNGDVAMREAAEAIERLQAQVAELEDTLGQARIALKHDGRRLTKAEHELAEARAENERWPLIAEEVRRLLRGMSRDDHGYRDAIFKLLDEALAAPAPDFDPAKEGFKDYLERINEPTPEREAERRVVEAATNCVSDAKVSANFVKLLFHTHYEALKFANAVNHALTTQQQEER